MKNNLENYKDQVILVTGGAGAIGSNLSLNLAEAGAARVIILDDLCSPSVNIGICQLVHERDLYPR